MPSSSAADLLQLIADVNRRLVIAVEARLRPVGLSIEPYRVLAALRRRNGMPMGELAVTVAVDSPTLTKIIDRMIDRALVYRAPDTQDRRRVLVFTSDSGNALMAEIDADLQTCQGQLVAHLGAQGSEQLRDLLQSFVISA